MKSEIVTKIDGDISPVSFDVSPFEKPGPGEKRVFEVNLIAEPEDKMRSRARVRPNLPTWSTFEIHCDEGTALGGEDSAPPPLTYLSAGIAFCLLTHLKTLKRTRDLEIDSYRIEQRVRFSIASAGNGDVIGACEGVETHVVVESREPREKIEEWVRLSRQACMAMQSVINATPQATHLHLNGTAVS